MRTFITSDLHLGHERILRLFGRPFKSVYHMNETIINNWNKTIKPYDKVYFLGDLSYRSSNTESWIPRLNGIITFIKGNHDYFSHIQYYNSLILKYKGNEFYLVHDPLNIPRDWKGWSICGHNHHERPFLDKRRRIFNVSVDITKYHPINMDYIDNITRKV